MIHILGGKLLVLHLILVGKRLIYPAQELLLGTLILSGGESEVVHALCLAQYGSISLLYLTWLSHTDKTEGTLGRRE